MDDRPDDRENAARDIDLSDDDIYEAMKDLQGYLDVTPGDIREVFRAAYRHALQRIYTSKRAADIMTSPVVTAGIDTPLMEVASLMAAKRISGLPVLAGDGKIAGVISERDYLSFMGSADKRHVMDVVVECLEGSGRHVAEIREKKAADIMSAPAITVGEDATAFEIMDIFSARDINRVPVVDRRGVLVGIVSRADVMKAGLSR